MKNYIKMRGLMAGKRQKLAMGDYVQPNQGIVGAIGQGVNNIQGTPAGQGLGLTANPALMPATTPGLPGGVSTTPLQSTLQQEVQGGGPSPAKALLAQATGANVANQAATIAGARGINPGLAAKLASGAGSQIQQNAAGQAAALTAEQQLAAQNQLAGLQTTQNQQALAQQANLNTTNAALAQAQMAAAQKTAGGVASGLGASNAVLAQPTGGAAQPASGYSANLAQGTANEGYGTGASPIITGNPGSLGAATGGLIAGPRSLIGQHIERMAKGGKVPALVSPGEIYLKPGEAKQVAKGQMSPQSGEKIKGKAKVKGDSEKNDTVKKTLDEGGVVIPRTKVNNGAAAFVRAVMAKHRSH